MNQIIKPASVNFTELVRNSKTTFSLSCESKMIDLLNQEFTEQESQWYITNLYIYMNYHPTNDYPINLEHVFKMIGFANKGNAMKTIKSNFTKDEDYKIVLFRTEKNLNGKDLSGKNEKAGPSTKNLGGRPIEDIMLNVDTFKNLCMIAKTDKGKEIRKYYVKLENIHNKIVKEELEQHKLLLQEKELQLEEQTNKLESTQKQLKTVSKLKVKKWYDSEPGDGIYAVISNQEDENSLIKLGKTKDGASRENGYMTHNQSGEMFYMRKCYNCNLSEKVLHHILDKYRVQNNREWFEISKELAIYAIDAVCNFLDYFINFSEELPNSELLENLNKSLEIVKNLSNDDKLNYDKDELIIVTKPVKIKPKTEPEVKPEVIKENVYDFVKFFKDKCEINVDYECTTYDIYGAYRLWSKNVRIEYKNELTKYLNDNYKKKRKYFKDIKTSMTMYTGFRVKPFIITQENPNHLPKYEEFILQNCDFGYNNKIRVDNFMNERKKWFKNYPDYVMFLKKWLWCFFNIRPDSIFYYF